jgi:hypothetical protein
MFASIVATVLILHFSFTFLGLTSKSAHAISDVAQFKLDYTFWLNLMFAAVTVLLVTLHRRHIKGQAGGGMDHGGGGLGLKRVVVYLFMLILAGGLIVHLTI